MVDHNQKQSRFMPRPYPASLLKDTLVIATAIQEKNAGKPMKRLLLADAVGRKPASSAYHQLLSSSIKFGLTIGSEKAIDISLTPLGEKVSKPVSEAEKQKALKEAALKPELFAKIYKHYNNAKIPSGTFFQNVLEREFGVPREHVAECERFLVENGRFSGIVVDISGAPRVMIDQGEEQQPEEAEKAAPVEVQRGAGEEELGRKVKVSQIFIAHGKSRKPLDQIKKILDELKVNYRVALEEPHSGRPISEKVAEIMRECTSGIFIFTRDEKHFDERGNEVLRPSENVVYELGAGSILYGNKIVIFREEGVAFPSDFNEIGHITFESDKLDAKAPELIKELVGFGILRISAA